VRAVAVNPGRREVSLIDLAEPSLVGASDVKLRILEVGVCGTDREICAFQYGTPPPGSPVLVIGHESLGQVLEIGRDVTGLHVGDLVVAMVRRPCTDPTCVACRAGRPDFCFTGGFTERGIKGLHGFMTELIVDEERYLCHVPRGLVEVAVLVEPLTIIEKALTEVWRVQARLPWGDSGKGHRALVLGAGPVGLLATMKLLLQGFDVMVFARAAAPNPRSAVVAQLGATYVSGEKTPLDELAKKLDKIDLIFEATGSSRAAFEALPWLGPNGMCVLTGVPGQGPPVKVDTDALMRRLVLDNQVVLGTVNASRDSFESAIRDLAAFLARWPAALHALITEHHPPEDAPRLLLGKPHGIKEVVSFRAH
jgi:threonine dehydrogenase-like Zn-dependent dehydrogenase